MADRAKRFVSKPQVWQWMLLIYWLALLVGTHLPRTVPLVPGSGIDKFVHLAAFALLALLLATTWQLSSGRLNASHLRAAWFIIAVYAAFDEWTQIFVGRDASFADWLADVTGAAVGLLVFKFIRRLHPE